MLILQVIFYTQKSRRCTLLNKLYNFYFSKKGFWRLVETLGPSPLATSGGLGSPRWGTSIIYLHDQRQQIMILWWLVFKQLKCCNVVFNMRRSFKVSAIQQFSLASVLMRTSLYIFANFWGKSRYASSLIIIQSHQSRSFILTFMVHISLVIPCFNLSLLFTVLNLFFPLIFTWFKTDEKVIFRAKDLYYQQRTICAFF